MQFTVHAHTWMGQILWSAQVSYADEEYLVGAWGCSGNYEAVDAPTAPEELWFLMDQIQRALEDVTRR